jgi:hypothetical protein
MRPAATGHRYNATGCNGLKQRETLLNTALPHFSLKRP